jgi:hypothetical protein
MKTYSGVQVYFHALNFGTRCRLVIFTPRPLYSLRKSPRYPLEGRLGGPQSRSGQGGQEKKSQSKLTVLYNLAFTFPDEMWKDRIFEQNGGEHFPNSIGV